MRRFSLLSLLVAVAIAAVFFRFGFARIETVSDGLGFHAATDHSAYLTAKADLCTFLSSEGFAECQQPRWYTGTDSDLDTWFVKQANATPIYVRVFTTESRLDAEVSWHKGFSHILSDGASQISDLHSVKEQVASWFFAWQAIKGLPGIPPSSMPECHQTAFPGSPALPKYIPK